MDFRGVLRARRRELGMTQLDLARVVGVTPAAISYWEKGEYHPSYKASSKLAKALGMSERDLFYPQEEPEEKEDSRNVP